ISGSLCRYDSYSKFTPSFIYIALDIFRRILHNNGITGIANDLDAWLTFFSEDDPETIVELFTKYPYFKPLYEDIYRLCENMEDIMGYFSEMLTELDRNTVQYMIEEQQGLIGEQKAKIEEQQNQLEEQRGQLEEQRGQLEEQQETIETQKAQIEELKRLIAAGKISN
ncbi:MAG: hypothetical protein LUF30_04645, partial [Lachnospiraceae bacterium]|nr:hypothetical protein [Lachnospiraceae bacterium]